MLQPHRAGRVNRGAMAAYVLATVRITDPAGYEEYRRLVPATIERYGGRFVVRGGRVDVLEGSWEPARVVIVEFPSLERARAWWESPEYAEARGIRQATSDGTLVVLEGV